MSLNGSLIEKRILYGHLSSGGRGGGTSLPSDEELLELFINEGLVDPLGDEAGAAFIDENNNIYVY